MHTHDIVYMHYVEGHQKNLLAGGILDWACDYLPLLGLKLIHVNKRDPWQWLPQVNMTVADFLITYRHQGISNNQLERH